MTKTMTKKELFTALLNLPTIQARPDFVAGLEHELDLLNRKNATRKPTAKQEEGDEIIARVIEILSDGEGRTVTEILKMLDMADLSHSRLNQLIKKAKDAGTIEREEVKRKAYFFAAGVERKSIEQ